MPKMIDCTPTWSNILPLLLELLQNSKTRPDATLELQRMAQAADAYVASQKEKKISG